jgi:uncharacterized delta-60 repeat protein
MAGLATCALLLLSTPHGWSATYGGLDSSFNPGGGNNSGLDADVYALAVQPDGRVVLGGAFTKVGRTDRGRVARLMSDGSLDTSFNPGTGANGLVESLVLQPDGRVTLAGRFTQFNGVSRPYLARLETNGSLDTSFAPVANGLVVACALQADGRLLIVGAFTSVNNLPRRYVARLNPDGSVDPTFDPGAGPDQAVLALALPPSQGVFIGGAFNQVSGQPRARIARLRDDGTVDTGFDPGLGVSHWVQSLAMQPDGRVLVGGNFRTLSGVDRVYLGRVEASGTLDSSFDARIALGTGMVLSIRPQIDGRLLFGGEFYWVNDVSRRCVARVDAQGILDVEFDPGTGPVQSSGYPPFIRALAIQNDGKVLVGGSFTTFAGVRMNYVARLLGEVGGSVEFSASSFTVVEGQPTPGLELVRAGSLAGPVTVDIGVTGGTATAGLDFHPARISVRFEPGESAKPVPINILADGISEGEETVILTLGNVLGGAALGPCASTTLTIRDGTTVEPPRFTRLELLADQRLRLTLEAHPGVVYTLEFSSDLSGWEPVQTLESAGTSLAFEEPVPAGAHGYYRATVP